jgi:hypothetical protein
MDKRYAMKNNNIFSVPIVTIQADHPALDYHPLK